MEDIDKWRKAGKIAAEVLEYGRKLIVKGASYKDVTEKIEAKIKELGAEPAFPPQMALNDVAAHFTVDPDEDIIFEDQIVCLDVGVHIDGCIGDTACTVDLSGKNEKLVKASRMALEMAIKTIQSGELRLSAIGKSIQITIENMGFVPIRNLGGHGLGVFEVHTPPTIPNYDTEDDEELEKDSVFAIEPFATTGAGMIHETEHANIFSFVERKPIRSQITRQVLKEIDKYNNLPFTTRWLTKKFPLFKVNFALKELMAVGSIRKYAPLPDKNKGLVSQAEHSFYLDKDGELEILTKLD
ncbi:MAG: type II methionyl aminopeptidase [Candidatus Woesearchaeota archaeon]